METYTCHSGGCPGADMFWERSAKIVGIKTIAYSFPKHAQEGEYPKILNSEELNEGWDNVVIASKSLNRNLKNITTYVRCLLSRNWFQVKNSDSIFAIGKFINEKTVDGTGWAVQMSIDNKKPTFIFEQNKNHWYRFNYEIDKFEECDIPALTLNFAGIGTREINDAGKKAIIGVFLKYANDNDLT